MSERLYPRYFVNRINQWFLMWTDKPKHKELARNFYCFLQENNIPEEVFLKVTGNVMMSQRFFPSGPEFSKLFEPYLRQRAQMAENARQKLSQEEVEQNLSRVTKGHLKRLCEKLGVQNYSQVVAAVAVGKLTSEYVAKVNQDIIDSYSSKTSSNNSPNTTSKA